MAKTRSRKTRMPRSPEALTPMAIQKARAILQWRQDEMGAFMGVYPSAVSNWESGRFRPHPCVEQWLNASLSALRVYEKEFGTELMPNKERKDYLERIHPCDMILYDGLGAFIEQLAEMMREKGKREAGEAGVDN